MSEAPSPPWGCKAILEVWNLVKYILYNFCICSPHNPIPPPVTHCMNTYPCMYLFTQERGGGGEIGEQLRGALVHKRGRKYQHDWLWLYLQPINSIKHQKRRHFGVWCLNSYLIHGFIAEVIHRILTLPLKPIQYTQDVQTLWLDVIIIRVPSHKRVAFAHCWDGWGNTTWIRNRSNNSNTYV